MAEGDILHLQVAILSHNSKLCIQIRNGNGALNLLAVLLYFESMQEKKMLKGERKTFVSTGERGREE